MRRGPRAPRRLHRGRARVPLRARVKELEEAYQANKRLKAELEKNQAELRSSLEPHFSNAKDRVQEVKAVASAGDSSASSFGSGGADSSIQSIFSVSGNKRAYGKSMGMRETNPGMWSDLLKSTPRTSGMPTVEDFLTLRDKK